MNVFDTHGKIIGDYASYIRSFITIADLAISKKVDSALSEGASSGKSVGAAGFLGIGEV